MLEIKCIRTKCGFMQFDGVQNDSKGVICGS